MFSASGLDVRVLLMHVLHSTEDLLHDSCNCPFRHAVVAPNILEQLAAAAILCNHVEELVIFEDFEELYNVWMVHGPEYF
jgi:hypothetical protein